MRIGIDARFIVENRRGIGNYSLELINNLAQIDSKNEYILYTHKDDKDNVLPKQKNFIIRKLPFSNYLVWEQFLLPYYSALDEIEVLHCTGNTSPLYLPPRIKNIITVHDVAYLKPYNEIPQSKSIYQKLGRIYRKYIVPRVVKNARKILTVSEFAKNDIVNSLSYIKEKDIVVTYLAVNAIFTSVSKIDAKQYIKDKFGINYDYIFGFAAYDPQKNTMYLIENFLELRKSKKINSKLVLAGLPAWKDTHYYKKVAEYNASEDIIFLEFINHADLLYLYNAAEIFIFPSLYESFGFPPLEAMSCGVSVITSKTGAIPEIVGNAAYLIDPRSNSEIQEAIIKLMSSHDLRNIYIQKGFNQIKKYSWGMLAKKTLDVYELSK